MSEDHSVVKTPVEASSQENAWISPASLRMPKHLSLSAWLEHAPFASWIIDAARPRSIVELGTHTGFSYFMFCEAIKRLEISAQAYALDTWQGDDHAGFYGDEIYESVAAINDADYASFSTLLRGYFDDSLDKIEDGSVDLLHIDGRHGYEDVRHDYEAWVPKLSDRGVVLFHDTQERENDFGVWKFWAEVSQKHPSFEFEHEHGLGVLAVGSAVPARVLAFIEAATSAPEAVRETYAGLGSHITTRYHLEETLREVESLKQELAAAHQASEELKVQGEQNVEVERERALGLQNQIDELTTSTSWKVTSPLRAVSSALHKR